MFNGSERGNTESLSGGQRAAGAEDREKAAWLASENSAV